MLKDYHDYPKKFIGCSDGATLVLVGCNENGVYAKLLGFGEDGSYRAYIVDANAEIGEHYHLVAEFSRWLRVYDDDERTAEFDGREIKVYRAREFGCIIQVIE